MDRAGVHQLSEGCGEQEKMNRGQKKRWTEDNVKEWTGLEFTNSQRATENRKRWRELVAKSAVVPQ